MSLILQCGARSFGQPGRDGASMSKALTAGRFNSPHAVTVGHDGSLYVTEWLIGGRSTKLRRLAG